MAFAAARESQTAITPGEVPQLLRHAEAAARAGSWVGVFVSYEAAPEFDRAHRVRTDNTLPLAWCGIFDAPLELDLSEESAAPYVVGPWSPTVAPNDYARAIASIHESIRRGDSYQVNYTFRLKAHFSGDDLGWFLKLRRAQPQGYCAYLDVGRYRILSASPELFFRRDGDVLTCKPMKGTAPRATSADQDVALAEWLRQSPKNRAENAMIVDVLRNDLARIATLGSVCVPALYTVQSFPTVHQMISTVTARARPDIGLDAVFAALFPCGSITGAPKISSMRIIADLETNPRDIYCGAIGLVSPGGNSIFNVAIRTIVLDTLEGTATCGVGGGITGDSTAEDEYSEALIKARFLDYSPSACSS